MGDPQRPQRRAPRPPVLLRQLRPRPGRQRLLPLYVGMNFGYQAQITKTPVLDAGEEITRKLAFGYPEGSSPSA